MKVSCQACGAKYTISDEKVRGRKVKIRCKSCGTPIVVDGQAQEAAAAEAAAAQAAAPAADPAAAPPTAGGAPEIAWSVNLSETDQRTMTTQEIVAGWQSGVVTHDAYVWKDGMADWVAIGECEELKVVLPAAGVPAGTPFGPTVVTAPMPAKLAGGRTGGGAVDLFDAQSNDEDEVATSAPHLPAAGTSAYDDGKMTGARNENSVLFSLDSLKGGLTGQAPGKRPEPQQRPPAPSGDPFAMGPAELGGANPLFSLNANQALLTAPAPPDPPPPRVEAVAVAGKPINKMVLYGAGAAGALILLLLGLLIGKSGGDSPEAEASARAAASALAAAEQEAADAKKKAEEERKKAEEARKKAEAAAAAARASASAAPEPAKVAANTGSGSSASSGSGSSSSSSGSSSSSSSSSKKLTKEEDTKTMPVSGSGPFSVSAAQVALTQAAANASSCAKSGGPTGTGKATVTFASSGRVTTANVSTPPFAGTSVGGCVAGVFRRARIPAFSGNPVTVSKSFRIN